MYESPEMRKLQKKKLTASTCNDNTVISTNSFIVPNLNGAYIPNHIQKYHIDNGRQHLLPLNST